MEYAGKVWQCCARSHKVRIQRLQNKALKMILNIPHWSRTTQVHQQAGVAMFEDRLKTNLEKFKTKCALSNIELIRNLFRVG